LSCGISEAVHVTNAAKMTIIGLFLTKKPDK